MSGHAYSVFLRSLCNETLPALKSRGYGGYITNTKILMVSDWL